MVAVRGWLALVSGGLVGFGVVLAWAAFTRASARRERPPSDGFWLVRVAVALCTAAAMALWTGWPVGTAAAGVGGWYAAGLVRWRRHNPRDQIAKMEAVASWAEQLRDGLAGQNGILGTIQDTAAVAPTRIRDQVQDLAMRLNRQRLDQALEQFAVDVDDPTAELIAAVLLVAGTQASRDVGKLLAELSAMARERVAMRQRVDAKRAALRTQQRGVVVVSALFMVGLTLFAREFIEPFATVQGQLVLLVVVGLFAGALGWLAALGRFRDPDRLLVTEVRS